MWWRFLPYIFSTDFFQGIDLTYTIGGTKSIGANICHLIEFLSLAVQQINSDVKKCIRKILV